MRAAEKIISGVKRYSQKDGNRNIVLLIFYLIIQTAVFASLTPFFLTSANIQNLMRQTAELGMVTIPLAIILMTGNIDMSIGSVMGVCAISLARLLKMGVNIWVAVLITILIGAFLGSINGFLVAKMHLAGIVATLGTQVMLRGVCNILTGGRPVSGLPREFLAVANIRILGMPISFIVMIIVFIIAIFIMQRTTFGVKIHAIGYNPKTSEYSGLNSDKIKFILFTLSGAVAAVAATFMLMRFASAEAKFASGYDTDTLTSLLIGGISIAGGSGNMMGALLGFITIATLRNGLNHLGVSSIYQTVILGVLIIISAVNFKKKN